MMPRIAHRPFSKRQLKTGGAGSLSVELSTCARNRVWKTLLAYDYPVSYQPDPNDRWIENTTGLRMLPSILERIYGCESIAGSKEDGYCPINDELKPFFSACLGIEVFDIVELFFADMPDKRSEFQRDMNEALLDDGFHWILCDGYFMKLDSEWMETNVLCQVHDHLGRGNYDGALEEFREARSYLAADDFKAAIHSAGKSFESLLKAIQGREDGNARQLVDGLKGTHFYDDFPSALLKGFGDSVLMTLPFIRNNLSGHGQGNDVVVVPRSIAELSVNLAGTCILFLIKRHLEVEPAPKKQGLSTPDCSSISDDEIPF